MRTQLTRTDGRGLMLASGLRILGPYGSFKLLVRSGCYWGMEAIWYPILRVTGWFVVWFQFRLDRGCIEKHATVASQSCQCPSFESPSRIAF
jgi:hypothetical protein